MGDHLGEEYDAHISGITSYGIYAEIDENHCEGMIPMRDLDDDYYDFDYNIRYISLEKLTKELESILEEVK